MRIPAIENDMMNRIGISRKRKAMARAATSKTKVDRSRSPYKSLLAGMARTEDDVLHATTTSDAEGSSSSSHNSPVRCASPSPLPESAHSPSHTRSASPQPPKLPAPPATLAGGTAAKGQKNRITRQCPVVLRPLPSRVAASSSRRAGFPAVHPHPRTNLDAPTIPEARPSRTRSSGGATSSSSPSHRSGPFSPHRRSPLAVASHPDECPFVPAHMAAASEDDSAESTKVQREGVPTAPCVDSGGESDSQSEDLSISDATSHEIGRAEFNVPDVCTADVAQAAAMKQSLLSQIEMRNEGRKWDDLLGFLHNLAPSEVRGVLKTATRAGRRALRRLAGTETADSDSSNGEDDARVLGRARRQGKSVLALDDAGSDGEGKAITQTTNIVPPRRRQLLYKVKGKACAGSPSPLLPSSPSPVFVSQTVAASAASSSHAPNCLSASASSPAARKRSRSPESASDDDDDDTSEQPPPKRQKKKRGDMSRPLQRQGAYFF